MKHLLLAAQIFFLAAYAQADPTIPSELVGIWASENAILKDGKWLTSGQALYLVADGSGALVGGPPPIGLKIAANFDSSKNVLSVDLLEHGKVVVKNQSVRYDPNAKTIDIGSSKPVLLTRRSEVVDPNIKKRLGF